MKITACTVLPLVAGLISSVSAHTTVYGLWVNDVFKGDGRNVYIRSPPNNNPVKNVADPSISCNVRGTTPVPQSVPVVAGDKITFEWYHDKRDDDIIAASHKGPVSVYITQVGPSQGTGPVWTKLAADGETLSGEGNATTAVWAVDKLIKNHGKHDVVLPAGLSPGSYLLKAEIIALHEGETDWSINPIRGAQIYPSCAQITVTAGGTLVPSQNFDFQSYTSSTPGILFNIYNKPPLPYPIPGPAVWAPTTLAKLRRWAKSWRA